MAAPIYSRSPVALVALLLLAAPLSGQTVAAPTLPSADAEAVGMSSERLARVGDVLQDFVDRDEVAGAVAIVMRHGQVATLDAAGVMSVDGGEPMRTDAIFRIASMTKPVTSVAAMMLVEEGALRLNDPVARYIPAFADLRVAILNDNGSEIVRYETPARAMNIRDLLTHRSGLTYGFIDSGPVGDLYREGGVMDGIGVPDGMDMADNVGRLARQPLVHHPGQGFQYGLSTDVLGHVVEVVSGLSLDEFFRTRIFEPLGMVDTHFAVPAEKLSRVAPVHTTQGPGGLRPVPMSPLTETRFFAGGAGLYSTAEDYARFAQMLLSGGALDRVRILSPRAVEVMTISHTEDLPPGSSGIGPGVDSPARGFGLGFGVTVQAGPDGSFRSQGSYDWGGIYGTTFWIDPAEDLLVVGMIQLQPNTAGGFGGALQTATYQAITDSRTFQAVGR